MKTIFFEKEYGVDIDNFKSTVDVDSFIESKIGRKLKVIKCDTNDINKRLGSL